MYQLHGIVLVAIVLTRQTLPSVRGGVGKLARVPGRVEISGRELADVVAAGEAEMIGYRWPWQGWEHSFDHRRQGGRTGRLGQASAA